MEKSWMVMMHLTDKEHRESAMKYSLICVIDLYLPGNPFNNDSEREVGHQWTDQVMILIVASPW